MTTSASLHKEISVHLEMTPCQIQPMVLGDE